MKNFEKKFEEVLRFYPGWHIGVPRLLPLSNRPEMPGTAVCVFLIVSHRCYKMRLYYVRGWRL